MGFCNKAHGSMESLLFLKKKKKRLLVCWMSLSRQEEIQSRIQVEMLAGANNTDNSSMEAGVRERREAVWDVSILAVG